MIIVVNLPNPPNGGSGRGLAPGGDWRCLPLAGLSEVSVYEGTWHTKPHSQPQRCVDEVDAEVVF